MLKYGTNLLQAVGEFNGNYIVAVVFMSIKPTPDPATLLNYVQPTPASVDPDSEIIEGPSRISLNCPISFKRIKTPVKGQSCKHLQVTAHNCCANYD
nr:E4 SUMO-protein ligase PIAL2-like isoform X2 [Ipomoea batatas]